MTLRQKTYLSAVVVANGVAWAVPSNVVALIARGNEVLMGRYSREHFTLNLGVLFISLVGFYIDRANGEAYKKRWFQVVAILLFVAPCVMALDAAARLLQPTHYIRDTAAYHRPPHVAFTRDFEDKPQAVRSYPNAPRGFGTVKCEYHADARGFRNRDDLSHADIVVLGDSFAEGSNVSDDDAWPARLDAGISGSVCNLGMSGYSPPEYLASLEIHGLPLKPRIVLCSIYEGNDFREEKADPVQGRRGLSDRLKHYVKQSPLRNAVDRLLISAFGGVGADTTPAGVEILSWLPLAAPPGNLARFYAFDPKDLLDAARSEAAFEGDRRWRVVTQVLSRIQSACSVNQVALIVVYVPAKVHVLLPLARESLPAEKVRAFAALQSRKCPDAVTFVKELFANLSAKEDVVGRWCAANGVEMIRLAEALRQAAAAGEQVYYTYDQHWTPIGHEVAAREVADRLGELGLLDEVDPPVVTPEAAESAAFSGSSQ